MVMCVLCVVVNCVFNVSYLKALILSWGTSPSTEYDLQATGNMFTQLKKGKRQLGVHRMFWHLSKHTYIQSTSHSLWKTKQYIPEWSNCIFDCYMLTEQNLTVINSNQLLIHEFNEYTNEYYDGVGLEKVRMYTVWTPDK